MFSLFAVFDFIVALPLFASNLWDVVFSWIKVEYFMDKVECLWKERGMLHRISVNKKGDCHMPEIYRIANDCILDLTREELSCGERTLHLPLNSWKILEALVRRNGILRIVEGINILYPEENTGDVTDITNDPRITDAVRHIRALFRQNNISARIEKTQTRTSYKLVPPPILVEGEHDVTKKEPPQMVKPSQEDDPLDLIDNIVFRERVKSLNENIHLATKRELEHPVRFPLTHKLNGIDHMTLLNYAGTSFLQNKYIASVYKGSDQYSKWFFNQLINGGLEADVILTNPNSYAAKDAAICKMYPSGRSVPTDEIIQLNINLLLDFKKNHPNANVHLYLTDICLPYGIMLGESYSDPTRDFMKIDIYSPLTYTDDNRPSFFLLAENSSSKTIYNLFKQVITHILSNDSSTKRYIGKNTGWLLEKPIIHRGRIRNDLPEHSINGYWECIKTGFPMEVDIFFLKDGTPMVGRNAKLIAKLQHQTTDDSFFLSDLTLAELRSISTDEYQDTFGQALKFRVEELMSLSELLNLVNGTVGLLIEIKEDATSSEETTRENVKSILDVLRYYSGNYAIHSANPNVLKEIRPHNMMVPLGLISWSFSGIDIPDWYKNVHASLSFDDIGQPDFISYKSSEIADNALLNTLRQEHSLPLLAWTICSAEDEVDARNASCVDNVIIEGASSFL